MRVPHSTCTARLPNRTALFGCDPRALSGRWTTICEIFLPSRPISFPNPRVPCAAMRMLFPNSADAVDPAEVYADLPSTAGRPSVRLNMIVSVDGGTSWNGVSGGLGGPADKALFSVMRSLTDVVLVASGTMRAEHYGRPSSPNASRRLAGSGQRLVPPIAVVSQRCEFDWESPFFSEAVERPLIITVSSADASNRARAAEVADVVIAGEDLVDLSRCLELLGERGARAHPRGGRPDAERRARARRAARRTVRLAVAAARQRGCEAVPRGPRSTSSPAFDCARFARKTTTSSCGTDPAESNDDPCYTRVTHGNLDDGSQERYYHGTRADLSSGDLIEPGYRSNYGSQKQATTSI